MQPRLKNSRKWTALPQELVQQIQLLFQENFSEHINGGKVEAGGKIFPEELLVVVGLKRPGQLKQQNWEISIDYKRNKDNVLKLLHLAVDAVAALFEQLFAADNDHDFPRVWQEVDFENQKIFIQYSTTNTELESEADRLLGMAEDQRVAQGDWDEDIQPDHIKAHLGLVPDEDEEDKPPPSKKKPTQH